MWYLKFVRKHVLLGLDRLGALEALEELHALVRV
jgi:hypothetical protein